MTLLQKILQVEKFIEKAWRSKKNEIERYIKRYIIKASIL
jgi:hypothetical protein